MAPSFPSQFELRCSGISLIVANMLWMVAFWVIRVDYDLYNVATNESVIELHGELSSAKYRFKVELSCVLMWVSFPLLLAAIYGIKKMIFVLVQNTPGIHMVLTIYK